MNAWFETEFHQILGLGHPGNLQAQAILQYIKDYKPELTKFLINQNHWLFKNTKTKFLEIQILDKIHYPLFDETGPLGNREKTLNIEKLSGEEIDVETKCKFILGALELDDSLGRIARHFLSQSGLKNSKCLQTVYETFKDQSTSTFKDYLDTKQKLVFLCFTEANPWETNIEISDGIIFNCFLLGWIKIEGLSELQRKLDLVTILRIAEAVPKINRYDAYDSASFAYLFVVYWQGMKLDEDGFGYKSRYNNSIQEAVDKKLFDLWQKAAKKIENKSKKYKRKFTTLQSYFEEHQWLCDHMGKTVEELAEKYEKTWEKWNESETLKINKTYLESKNGYHYFKKESSYDDHFTNYIVTKYISTLVLFDSFQQPSQ